MSKVNLSKLALFLVGCIVIFGGASLLKGGLYTTRNEGDTLHFAEIVLRMTAGEIPHLDFLTPIGFFAFVPIVAFTKLGMGLGFATLLAQVVLAVLCVPMVLYISKTRLTPAVSYLFGGAIMLLCLAILHGQAEVGLSISMHYNRWAWAAAALAIVTSFVAPKQNASQIIDGVLIGAMLSVLALTKMTYFVSFVIPVAMGLILRGQMRAVGVAMATGAVSFVIVTVVYGSSFWLAYLRDLLAVAGSDVRPNPGVSLTGLLASPAYVASTLTTLWAIMRLRQNGKQTEGLLLLLFFPGFVFVTYQNFGNDPQWLLILAVLLFAVAQRIDDATKAKIRLDLMIAASIALALTAPSYFNLAFSPLRHFNAKAAQYVPMLPAYPQHDDVFNAEYRAGRIDARIELTSDDYGLAHLHDENLRAKPTVFRGEVLENCRLEMGAVNYNTAIAETLNQNGFTGGQVLVADMQSALWFFGDFTRLENGAPWYYSGLPGYETADLLLVPTCPLSPVARSVMIKELNERGTDNLHEVFRDPLFTLFKISR